MTRIGPQRVHEVRTRGGHIKFRGLRLDQGNFSWGSEGELLVSQSGFILGHRRFTSSWLYLVVSRKTRLLTVVYNASNNELVRTNTLVKNCIVQVSSAILLETAAISSFSPCSNIVLCTTATDRCHPLPPVVQAALWRGAQQEAC